MKKISPSILSADFGRLAEEVRAVEEAGADYIHIDVMDGHFVPNITIGPFVVAAVKKVTKLPLDVHLMIENPGALRPGVRPRGLRYHNRTRREHAPPPRPCHADKRLLARRRASLINPATPVHSLGQIIADLDLVLVMSVNPGFSGQSFIPSSLNKIKKVRSIIEKRGSKAELEVDGGDEDR